MSTIRFFHPRGDGGFLSNFSSHGFHLDGTFWPTVEHYYQAQKFLDPDLRHGMQQTDSPKLAKHRARTLTRHIREDWAAVRDDVMWRAICAKFETHASLRGLLNETGDAELIEDSPADF